MKKIPNIVLLTVFNKIKETLNDKTRLEELILLYQEDDFDPELFRECNKKSSDSNINSIYFNELSKTVEETITGLTHHLKFIKDSEILTASLFDSINSNIGHYVRSSRLFEDTNDTMYRVQQKSNGLSPIGIQIGTQLNNIPHYSNPSIDKMVELLNNVDENRRRHIQKWLYRYTNEEKDERDNLGIKIFSVLFPEFEVNESLFSPNANVLKCNNTNLLGLCGLINLVRMKFKDSRLADLSYKVSIDEALEIAAKRIMSKTYKHSQLLLPNYSIQIK
ncbi:MAG: hypothetical protein LAT82_00500 [Nanoarchaeota archaeon]|nr:hypothetical protein [Nanoarchaeota archaeon]